MLRRLQVQEVDHSVACLRLHAHAVATGLAFFGLRHIFGME